MTARPSRNGTGTAAETKRSGRDGDAAGLAVPAAILVGVINAAGGGVLRDVLTREEPLVFKPGQFYVLTALAGASPFSVSTRRGRSGASVSGKRSMSSGCSAVLPTGAGAAAAAGRAAQASANQRAGQRAWRRA